MPRLRALSIGLAALLLFAWRTPLHAEEPVLVDFDAKVVKARAVQDDQGKTLKLKKNEKVNVRYMRGKWCWLQTKAKKSAWVECATLRPSQPPASKAAPPATAEPATTTTAAAASQPASAASQPAVATATETAASSAPAAAATSTAADAVAAKLANAAGKRKLLVMSLVGTSDVGDDVQAAIEGAMAQALDKLGPFATVAQQDLAGMLEFEAAKQRAGCESASCLAEIGGALGVDYLVTGRLMLTEQVYLLQLTLTDVKQATVVARASREHRGSPVGLIDQARSAVRELAQPLLAALPGTIALSVSESDATISVDGSIVGVSPLASVAVPAGPHTLRVEKNGFVRWARDVEVPAKQTVSIDVKLVPSAEYRDAFRGRNLALRIGAFSALGVGALGLAGAGGLYAWRWVQADALRQKIEEYNAQSWRDPADREQLLAERRAIATYDIIAVSVAGGSLLVALTGAILFLISDDPGRYDQ